MRRFRIFNKEFDLWTSKKRDLKKPIFVGGGLTNMYHSKGLELGTVFYNKTPITNYKETITFNEGSTQLFEIVLDEHVSDDDLNKTINELNNSLKEWVDGVVYHFDASNYHLYRLEAKESGDIISYITTGNKITYCNNEKLKCIIDGLLYRLNVYKDCRFTITAYINDESKIHRFTKSDFMIDGNSLYLKIPNSIGIKGTHFYNLCYGAGALDGLYMPSYYKPQFNLLLLQSFLAGIDEAEDVIDKMLGSNLYLSEIDKSALEGVIDNCINRINTGGL